MDRGQQGEPGLPSQVSVKTVPTIRGHEQVDARLANAKSADGLRAGAQRNASHIKNKQKRAQVLAKQKWQKKKAKSDKRRQRQKQEAAMRAAGVEPPPKQKPKTIEDMREEDDTMVAIDDDEVLGDEADDEFSGFFKGVASPKIMVTTQHRPSGSVFPFIKDLVSIFPRCYYYKRGRFPLKKICEYARNLNFSHLMVVGERMKVPVRLLLVNLAGPGPTALFRITSIRLRREIRRHGNPTSHTPELILNNFGTRLGRRIGRLFGSLIEPKPEFVGRQVVTFHNQRDFIFVRQHRYVFTKDGKATRLQELGPKFTLKLLWLQDGTFDPSMGEYEWTYKRHQLETSKRKFFL